MSGELTIRWSGGERRFPPGTQVRIGRDEACEVVVGNGNVSRHHASVTHDGTGWTLRDEGSAQGTFADGRAITELRLGGPLDVTLGAPQVGERLELSTGMAVAATRPRMSATDAVDTVVPDAARRPGGALRDDVFEAATVVGGQTLRVECGGRTYQFSPGRSITIGRDASADIVSSNPTVSRGHATITHDAEGWKIEDSGSSAGTFIDGRRIGQALLTGSTAVWLGDPETGERVVIVTGGEKATTPIDKVRKISRSRYLGIAAAGAAVVAVGVAVVALTTGNGPVELDRDQLARGVVRIETSEGSVGSGTVIDAAEGLILTNAHVVAPRAPGQGVVRDLLADELGEQPRTISIAVSDGLDEIAEPRYQGETVAADGYLDLAVVKITRTSGGALIEPGDLDGLVSIPVASSSSAESGDPIRILGHPTVARSNAATLTTGVLAGPVQDTRLDSNRAYVNLDAEIRPGNSGGLVADAEGRIIGVPTLNWIEDTNDIGAMRPIAFAEPLLEAARAGEDYASPYVAPLTGNEDLPSVRIGRGADAGFRPGCTSRLAEIATGDNRLSLQVDYTGFVDGQHQDVAVAITDAATGDFVGFASTAYDWPLEFEGDGCVSLGMSLAQPLAAGTYFVDFFMGPNYEFDDELSFSFEL